MLTMRSLRAPVAFVAAIAVGGLCQSADATTALLLSREELTERATAIGRVTVGRATTRESDDGTSIVTRTELTFTQCLKGACGTTATVEQVGGTFNGKTQRLIGDGHLQPGEDAVVFLTAGQGRDSGVSFLTALALSVYHVDARGLAQRDLEGLGLMRRSNGRLEHAEVDEKPEPVEKLMTDLVRIAKDKK
jgi:hypothetical protein